jgi:polygalacturonase
MRRRQSASIGLTLLGASVFALVENASCAPVIAVGDQRGVVTAPVAPAICATLTPRSPPPLPQAETAETKLDTARIQSALNRCGDGRAVALSENQTSPTQMAFLSGPLTLPPGVSLIIDRGITLFASRQAALYDNPNPTKPGAGHCGQYDSYGRSCRPLITIHTNSDGGGVYGPGGIDGQGGRPIIYPSSWALPAVCSSSAMVASFPVNSMSWWDLSNCVNIINSQKMANATMRQDNPALIEARGVRNLVFYNLTLTNASRSHILISQSSDITIWGVKINTPSDNAPYGMPRAHNTDGIDLGNVRDVTISESYINAGDDHIAIGSKSGPINSPTSNITISDDHFYGGHGISIGSGTAGGVQNVLVENVVVDGGPNMAAISAIHIKSNAQNGGLVKDITYRNLCIRDTKYPIYFDTRYRGLSGTSNPQYINIYIADVSIFNDAPGGGKIFMDGSGASKPIQVTMKDILIDDPKEADSSASQNVALNLAGKLNFTPNGRNVSVNPSRYTFDKGARPKSNCENAFSQPPPFAISQR